MGSKTATAERNRQRAANTEALMANIMAPGAGEISKAREAELQRAANYGRGVQYIAPNPYVKGLTQKGGQPVLNPNGSFTGRIVANEPTLRELGGDIVRGLIGGQAQTPSYINAPTTLPGTPTTTSRQYTPQPEAVQGLIPAVAERFMVPGGIAFGIAKDLFQKFFPVVQAAEEEKTIPASITGFAPEGFTFPTNIQRERGPTVDLRSPTIEEQITTPVGGSDLRVDVRPQDIKTLKPFISTGMGYSDIMSGFGDIIQSLKQQNPTLTDDEIRGIIEGTITQPTGQFAANGGVITGTNTIPPQSGPMSSGVASLFKNK